MRNFLILCLLGLNAFNYCLAQELVLSDRIREAREAELRKIAQERLEKNLTPIKNNKTTDILGEQQANEVINPQEILCETNKK